MSWIADACRAHHIDLRATGGTHNHFVQKSSSICLQESSQVASLQQQLAASAAQHQSLQAELAQAQQQAASGRQQAAAAGTEQAQMQEQVAGLQRDLDAARTEASQARAQAAQAQASLTAATSGVRHQCCCS